MTILAGDIGGTKVLLQISDAGKVLLEQSFVSAEYDTFESLLSEFLQRAEAKQLLPVKAACLGVAGPVEGRRAKVTNLPWMIDADQLEQQFAIPSMVLINDFQAVGYGIEALNDDQLVTLQQGKPQPQGVRALIGAGTGLGQGIMVWCEGRYQVLPTEGGHVDFAPTDELQMALWQHLRLNAYRVTYEDLVSGKGLVKIYNFLSERSPELVSQKLVLTMKQQDAAATISQFALESHDKLANQALDMFIKIYGAQAGNMALSCLPKGGLFIAGGIAPKIIERLQSGGFIEAFSDKAPMAELMPQFSVQVVMEPRVGLLGAAVMAKRAAG